MNRIGVVVVLALTAVFAFLVIAAVVSIRETMATVRQSLPELTNAYLIVEGLPAEPAETAIQYYQEMEGEPDSARRGMVGFIIFAAFVTACLCGFLLIGPEGLNGLTRQVRLLRLRRNRNGSAERPRAEQRRDDDWMDEAWQQPQPTALPAPRPSTPWLLPAPREGDDNPR